MQKISRVHILQALQYLVNDILFMDVFKDVCADYCMKISIHEVEYQIDISIVFSPNNVLQPYDVFMASQLLQENNLTEGTLCICCILEGIKVLL